MAGAATDNDEEITGINVTPLVDIVLVLLIIFMVTANLIVHDSMEVDLPRAANAGEAVEGTIAIVMDKDGRLFFDGAEVTEDELKRRVDEQVAKDPKSQAILSADQSLNYGRVMHLMDVVKGEGVSTFMLNIEKDASASSASPPAQP